MARYKNYHFSKLMPEKDLQESILFENPASLNLDPPRKMNEFMRDLIFEKRAGQPRGSSRLEFIQAATRVTR